MIFVGNFVCLIVNSNFILKIMRQKLKLILKKQKKN